jgi:hypothetical protein
MTVNDKVARLSNAIKGQLIESARNGETITSMADRLKLDYGVVQTYLWQEGTLPWQGAKTIITRRLRSLRTARRQDDRNQLVDEVLEQVDYLYYVARRQQQQLDKIKSSVSTSKG